MPTLPDIAYFIEPTFGENAFVVSLGRGSVCWIVDPGLPPSAEQIIAHVRAHDLRPEAIVLTHAHSDHIAGIPEVLEELGELPAYLADEEADWLTDPMLNLSGAFGVGLTAPVKERRPLAEGDILRLGDTEWRVLDTSGHSPGGRTLHCAAANVAIAGDALFADSIGRYDFPTSDGARLFRNIRKKLLPLPPETMLYCGHGPRATIAAILRRNPYAKQILAGAEPD